METVVGFVIVPAVILVIGIRTYFKGGTCRNQIRLDGKTVIVTGCNTGIGKETALEMSKRGARVLMACRNLESASNTAQEIRDLTKGEVVVYQLDLSSLKSVRQCAREILENEREINILINNAGVFMCPYQKTEDGFEMHIGTNHFGHFLFTNLLLEKMKEADKARIANVSARLHEHGHLDLDDINWEKRRYSKLGAYNQSKIANILFTVGLAKRLRNTKITTYSLHPGVINTDLGRHLLDRSGPLGFIRNLFWSLAYPFTKTPKEGAQTTIFC